jgi:hypothetical protein
MKLCTYFVSDTKSLARTTYTGRCRLCDWEAPRLALADVHVACLSHERTHNPEARSS